MLDIFANPAARAEYEAWHDAQNAKAAEQAAAANSPKAIAARYKAMADAALYAMKANDDLAKLDASDLSSEASTKRLFRTQRKAIADLQLGIAFAALNTGYDHEWLDDLYEAAGYERDEDGEWADPSEPVDTFASDVAFDWRHR